MIRGIYCRTNVDKYKGVATFPKLDMIPRIGETVEVSIDLHSYYQDKKLPTRMQVVDVTHTSNGIIVELWFKDVDVKAAELNGVNLFQ